MDTKNELHLYDETKRLTDMGFACLWLYPKTKRPIGEEWAAGPKKPWAKLDSEYAAGNNVGVRLGTPSRIGGRYLCVIDVDVKSEEKRHRLEAVRALESLVGFYELPEVRSGRGNGSRHLYCLTGEPFKTWNPFESEETVRYFSPSKRPNKRERAELSGAELEEGVRIGKAWEISLYSDGRQVVLPPSIHPDTGKPYFWKKGIESLDDLPVMDFGTCPKGDSGKGTIGRKVGAGTARGPQEEIESVDVVETVNVRRDFRIDKATRDLIVKGRWKGAQVEDRSSYLLVATSGLVSCGLTRGEILGVLTDSSTYLGECAYDHAQTKHRARAAKWLWNYTVKKVVGERDPVSVFGAEPVVSGPWDDAPSEREGWSHLIDRAKSGQPHASLMNCKIILENVCGTAQLLGRDEFAQNDFYLVDTLWRSKKGDAVVDLDIVRVKEFCAKEFGVEFGDSTIVQTLSAIADVNRYHPVRDYVRGLKWDGMPRLETWLKDFAGAHGPDKYLRAVSVKVLVAMVKRVFEPGCKFDHVLILEGAQGAGKSTLLSKLAGKWFTDQPLVIGDKDAVLTMQSKWLIELGELASMNRSEIEQMKAFVTQRTDRIRAPYGRKVEEHPRQSVFIGSTNQDEYLKDETGNRRFWPVACIGELDFDGIEETRDQLFAEAYVWYARGETLYLEGAELNQMAKAEQAKRGESDEWFGAVYDAVNSELFPRGGFDMRAVTKLLDPSLGAGRLDKSDQMRIAKCLKLLGFEKYRESSKNRTKLWRPTCPTSSHLGGPPKEGEYFEEIADFY